MTWQFEHSADSFAAPERIWQRYLDVEHWSDWSPGVEWSRLGGAFEVGTKGKSKPPGSPTLRFRVIAVEPQVMFATRVRLPGAVDGFGESEWFRSKHDDQAFRKRQSAYRFDQRGWC